ncbi:MAG: hypothetical protein CV087_23200 [Candidatus Brocadia sp. WS118]|nr:MAG: hypothetical protein CV087_23200 [Candidatus Brocadia sp. WS118]
MKPNILFQACTFLFAVTIVIGCSKEDRVIDYDNLVHRNGLWYEVNSEKPFSGRAIQYYKDIHDNENNRVAFSSLLFKKGELNYGTGYYQNGQKKAEGGIKDSLEHGVWRGWAENGQLLLEREMKMGKKDGHFINYYPENGQLDSKAEFKNDKLAGDWEHYYQNGVLADRGQYEDGKMVGIWEYFYDNSELWAEMEYRDGVPWNIVKHLRRDGSPIEGETLKDGNGFYFNYNQDETINYVSMITDGKARDIICGSYAFPKDLWLTIYQEESGGYSVDDIRNYQYPGKRNSDGKIVFEISGNEYHIGLTSDWHENIVEQKKVCIEVSGKPGYTSYRWNRYIPKGTSCRDLQQE